MPKELTHWLLATEARQQLPLDLTTRYLLEQEQSAYLVGVVLPDTLLHLIRGPWSATALKLAHDFHEPVGNSFTPLVRFAETTPLTPAMQACVLGIAAHMEADIVFHPYICALAGNNLGRHYQRETELDLWLLHTGKRPPVWRLEELLTDRVQDVAVTVACGIFDPEGSLPREVVAQALRLHSQIQGMYGSPGWQALARCLSLLPIPRLWRWQKLFYPFNWQRGRSQSWPDRWRHEVTAQQRGDTPEGLMADALTRITDLLRKVDQQGIVRSFRNHPGENLITGLAGSAHTPTEACVTVPP